MNIGILSYSWGEYTKLSDITFNAWQSYADRHGYTFVTDWTKEDNAEWQKPKFLLRELPKYDALLWVDCDTVCTNPLIKAEQVFKSHGCPPLMLSADCYGLNAGTMMMSNQPITSMLWHAVLEVGYPMFGENRWDEQESLIRFAHQHPYMNHVRVVEQRIMNSYINAEYNRPDDWGGTWCQGDWIIHFPGLPLERRIELAKVYVEKADEYVALQEPQKQSRQKVQSE